MLKKITKHIFLYFGIRISKTTPKRHGILRKKHKTILIGDINLKLNTDHDLPNILERWPNYSDNLPRLAKQIQKKYQTLILIDIGANVGDTVALLRKRVLFPIICIEGDSSYFSLLKQNMKKVKDVHIYNYFMDENSGLINGTIQGGHGTAQIVTSNDSMVVTTLDMFIHDHKNFDMAKIVKIDTDGYDLKIIRGGLKYIEKTKPILFFEYDELFLSKVGDDGLSTLNILKNLGYNKILFYDNYGRFLISTELKNEDLIEQLHTYIAGKHGAFQYYDLCVFHSTDDDVASECIKNESDMLFKGKRD